MNKIKCKQKKQNKSEKLRCKTCNKIFAYNSSLIKHKRIHTGEKPYICNIDGCNTRFSLVSNLIRHKKIHYGFKPFKCEICNKTFSSSSNLNQHKSIHNLKKKRSKYICFVNNCTKSYFYICTLKKHILSFHKKEYDSIAHVFSGKNFSHFYKKIEKKNTLGEIFPFVKLKFKTLHDENSECEICDENHVEKNNKKDSEIKEEKNLDKVEIKINDKDININDYPDECIEKNNNITDCQNLNVNSNVNNKDQFNEIIAYNTLSSINLSFDTDILRDSNLVSKVNSMIELTYDILQRFSLLEKLRVVFNNQTECVYNLIKFFN